MCRDLNNVMEEDMKIFGDIPGREKSKLKDCQTRKKNLECLGNTKKCDLARVSKEEDDRK